MSKPLEAIQRCITYSFYLRKEDNHLKKLNYFKKSLSERERLRFHVSIRNGDKIPVVYERKVFTTKTDVEASINKIKTALTNYVYGGRVVIVNYDIAYMEQNLDLAVCLEVAGKLSNTMGI